MKRKTRFWLALVLSIIMMLGGSMSVHAATELELSDGGSTMWYKYNTVYGKTLRGPSGQATVRCTLTLFTGGYNTVYSVVNVNISQATVKQTPALSYYRGGGTVRFSMEPDTISTSLGSGLKASYSLSNDEDYENYGSVSFYGARHAVYISYSNYGTWTSRNYIGTYF